MIFIQTTLLVEACGLCPSNIAREKVTFIKESEKTNVQVLKEPSLYKTVYFQRIRFLQNITISLSKYISFTAARTHNDT